MRNVSNAFKESLKNKAFRYRLNITMPDGSSKTISQDNLVQSGNKIINSCGTSSLPLGSAVSKQLNLSVANYSGEWDDIDLFGSVVVVYMTVDVGGGYEETLCLGTYTVAESQLTKYTIDIVAYDNMYLAGQKVFTPMILPSAMKDILRIAASQANLTVYDVSNVTNGSFLVTEIPNGATCRDVIGLCAMIAGGNAYVDQEHGYVIITKYHSDTNYLMVGDGSGTIYNLMLNDHYAVFTDASSGEASSTHTFTDLTDLTVSTDEIQITGIQTRTEDELKSYGADGYVLSIENGLITGHEEEAVRIIGNELVGVVLSVIRATTYRYPLCDIGDMLWVTDLKGRTHCGYVTDYEFDFSGETIIECKADSPQRNASAYYNSAEVKAIQAAKRLIVKEMTDRDVAIENLQKESTGLYSTEEVQADGSTITYLHDKPKMSESKLVIRMNANSIGISVDGGNSYTSGISLYDATMILNSIYTVGINAEHIIVGANPEESVPILDEVQNRIEESASSSSSQLVSTQDSLMQLSERIDAILNDNNDDDISGLSEELQALRNSVTNEIERRNAEYESINDLIKGLTDFDNDLKNYMYSDASGTYFKKAGSNVQIQITNDRINLMTDNTTVQAYISADGFVFERGILTNSLTLGNGWMWIPDNVTGHLRLIKR